jgi:hypothetical protein
MKTLSKSLGISRRKSSVGHADIIGLIDEHASSSGVSGSLSVISEADDNDNGDASAEMKPHAAAVGQSVGAPRVETAVSPDASTAGVGAPVGEVMLGGVPTKTSAAAAAAAAAAAESAMQDGAVAAGAAGAAAGAVASQSSQKSAEESRLDDIIRRRSALKQYILAWQSNFRDAHGRDPKSSDKKADPAAKAMHDA